MSEHDHESPFDNPPLSEGYPLDDTERAQLKQAIEELQRSPRDGRSSDPAERPAATTA